MTEPLTFVLFGRSGCGKGTQAQLLIEKLESQGDQVLYIETGNELRRFTEENNYTAKKTADIMSAGSFLPPFVPIWIWTNALVRKFDPNQHLILDGLSRRIHEAPILDSALQFYNRADTHVIHIDVSHDWARTRLRERKRGDDMDDATIEHRLRAFDYEVTPVLEYFYHRKGYRFHKINGEQSIADVHTEIMRAVGLVSHS